MKGKLLCMLPILFLLCVTMRGEDKVDPYKAIAGKWKLEKMELAGKEQKKDAEGEFVFGSEIVTMDAGESKVEFKHELRPNEKPPQINFFANSMQSKLVLKGIYKLNSDELVICVRAGTQERPTEFKTSVEGGEVMFVLKRKK